MRINCIIQFEYEKLRKEEDKNYYNIIIIIYNPPLPIFCVNACLNSMTQGPLLIFQKRVIQNFIVIFEMVFMLNVFSSISRFPLRHSFLKEFCLQGQCQPSQSRDFGKHLRITIPSHLHSSDFSTTYGKTAPGIPRSVESVAQKWRTSSEF